MNPDLAVEQIGRVAQTSGTGAQERVEPISDEAVLSNPAVFQTNSRHDIIESIAVEVSYRRDVVQAGPSSRPDRCHRRERRERDSPIADATPGISVESSQPTSITVTLMPPQEAASFVGYELRWRTTAETEFSPPVQIPMSQTSYTISGLVAGTDYVIEVRTVDTEGDGDWARLEAATTPASGTDGTDGTTNGQDPMDQRLPPDVSIGSRQRMALTVTWNPPATTLAVSKYVLHWQKFGAPSGTEVDNIGAAETSHTIQGLDQETTYRIRMKTVFTDNSESDWSITLEVATPGDVPEISIAAVADEYRESENHVWFRLTLTPRPAVALTVQVTVDEQGANRLDPDRPRTEVSVVRGNRGWTFIVGLRRRNPATQPDSTITVTLQDGPGYVIVSPASASTRVVDS